MSMAMNRRLTHTRMYTTGITSTRTAPRTRRGSPTLTSITMRGCGIHIRMSRTCTTSINMNGLTGCLIFAQDGACVSADNAVGMRAESNYIFPCFMGDM